jgi:uncharacterized heparinase superfamily protein
LARGEFLHLNQSRLLGISPTDWQLGRVDQDRLWVVTLHYHEWAFSLAEIAASGSPRSEQAADLFRALIGDWIARCALDVPGARTLAWNAYAIATRMAWWIRSYQVLVANRRGLNPRFQEELLTSLWQQADFLANHLEWDLRANHLLRDAVGLAWAGRFFQEDRAERWLARATRLGLEQGAEQVLADGGHFERSPMYHLQVMEELVRLIHLVSDEDARTALRTIWNRMAEWTAWMRHPDGRIPLFNDAAFNGACAPEAMLGLGKSLGLAVDTRPRRGCRHLTDTGMVVWQGDPWSVFFDVGPIGPDYQPGHAHADTLTLEASYKGVRLFVDPGAYAYDNDARRRYDRSTAAHNTVCIDGQDSSEVWHIFRVGRRAYPCAVRVDCVDGGLQAEASHDGYNHLPGRPRHARRVLVTSDGELTLIDDVEGKGSHALSAGLLLSPDWSMKPTGGGWVLHNGPRRVRIVVDGPVGLQLAAQPSTYHPEYGRELNATRLLWQYTGALPVQVITRVEGC